MATPNGKKNSIAERMKADQQKAQPPKGRKAVPKPEAPAQAPPAPTPAPTTAPQAPAGPVPKAPVASGDHHRRENRRGDWCSGVTAPQASTKMEGPKIVCPGCSKGFKPRNLGGNLSVPYHYQSRKKQKTAA